MYLFPMDLQIHVWSKIPVPGLPDGMLSNKNPHLGKLWRVLEWKRLVYSVAI
jgi:hypothetical protein